MNAAEDSPDAVMLAERVVMHKSYPALHFCVNQRARALLSVNIPSNCECALALSWGSALAASMQALYAPHSLTNSLTYTRVSVGLSVCLASAACYLEYFQHKTGQAAQYNVSPVKAARPLLACPAPSAVKASLRLAFEHAQRELGEVQRTRQVRQSSRAA